MELGYHDHQRGFNFNPPQNQYEDDFKEYCNTKIGSKAAKFDADNPHVYVMFAGYARQALSSKRNRFGIAAIWEHMRWELAFNTTEKEFKINNNHRAYYARKIMADSKDFHGFFVTKGSNQ